MIGGLLPVSSAFTTESRYVWLVSEKYCVVRRQYDLQWPVRTFEVNDFAIIVDPSIRRDWVCHLQD